MYFANEFEYLIEKTSDTVAAAWCYRVKKLTLSHTRISWKLCLGWQPVYTWVDNLSLGWQPVPWLSMPRDIFYESIALTEETI